MSSYFVNSFCGRYPNGADFQLHNYGDHSAAGEQYRDSAAVHAAAAAAGRYGGYGYNGVDLTVGRAGGGHFVAGERPSGYSPSHSTAVEPLRYGQTTAGSLSPPPEPLPCSSVASASPVPESPAQHRALKNSVSSSCSGSGGGSGGGALMQVRDCASKASSMEEEKPAGSAPTTPQNVSDSAQPQIYPWMRKLHMSHGKVLVFKKSCGVEEE